VVDWHYPDFPAKYSHVRKEYPKGYPGNAKPDADINKYDQYMHGQIRELLTNYGPIGILWFDGGGSFCNYDREKLLHGKKLVQMIHHLQPGCLKNDRLGFGADYGTPEQKIPGGNQGTAFEVCMTLNKHWGYDKYDHNWKSPEEVVQNLADIAGKGGNYLLNVGPTAKGDFPSPSGDILQKVGHWLDVYGESVYDSEAGPDSSVIRLQGGVITQKPGKLYLHVLHWPADRKVFVKGMKGHIVRKVYLLNDQTQSPLSFDAYDRSLIVHVPENPPHPYDSVLVVLLEKNASLYGD
jgi:alpha-L-fucosidase